MADDYPRAAFARSSRFAHRGRGYAGSMRVVIVGATGNVGTSVIEALAAEDRVTSILGLARRRPEWRPPKTEWAAADVTSSDLVPHFRGADAVVHLAWLIQPSRDQRQLRDANVGGSERVFRAVGEAGVPALVYASSVGAYSEGPKDRWVDEGWPTAGIATSFYSRHKAEVEGLLDRFEREAPSTRVVRLRPALIFKGDAAAEIRRLFAGPFLPGFIADRRLIPLFPAIPGLRFQAVHSRDVGEAFRLAIVERASGAFNLAAQPPLGRAELAEFLGARPVPMPAKLVRALTDLSWKLRLQPSPPGWLDMALAVPIMATDKARQELGWTPARTAQEALAELFEGLRHGRGLPTPPLDPEAGGTARAGEVRTGVGRS
jgi:UDP-glucose 4-epimerase